MMELNVQIFDSVEKAPRYTNTKYGVPVVANIVKDGTENRKSTVDLVMRCANGDTFTTMLSSGMIQQLAVIMKEVDQDV